MERSTATVKYGLGMENFFTGSMKYVTWFKISAKVGANIDFNGIPSSFFILFHWKSSRKKNLKQN